ncbi:NADP-dependent oxidoreductase [Neobacillus drentensis]|uniref:NADP-dependent oxidoreductase n=1 Tax=Neobacillus drentensis TaxID=220684 RepID=UPI0030010694
MSLVRPAYKKRIVLASRPEETATAENFRMEEVEIPGLQNEQVLVQSLYISVDPYMRGRMNAGKSYVAPYPIDGVILGGVIGRVIETASPVFDVGDIVLGGYGWQTYEVVSADSLRKIDASIAPITTYLGVLGMTGLTAYFGLLDIGKPKEGETVVVSGAAGAVGTVVGQIANIKGARSVGIAGSDDKCEYLTKELGFTAAINYREPDFEKQIEAACPNGVDVYFDNVGGTVSDTIMKLINHGARIPICGQIATYNGAKTDIGPRVQIKLLTTSSLMQGFVFSNYASRFAEGAEIMAKWVSAGKIKYQETNVEGFENTVSAFFQLFTGGNTGKLLVKVSE